MQTVESCRHKENRTVDVIASRKLNTVLVLVRLAIKKSNAEYDREKKIEKKAVVVVFNKIGVRDSDSNTRSKQE